MFKQKFKMIRSNKTKFNKKAIAINVLVSIIISLIFLVIVGTAIRNLNLEHEEKELEILCQNSIANRARTVIEINEDGGTLDLMKATIKTSPVLCETIVKKIKGDEEEIMREMAEKMAKCWWMFGEGKYEELLYGNDVTIFPALFGTDKLENSCFDCYKLIIDEKDVDVSAKDFSQFLFKIRLLLYEFPDR